MQVNTFFKIFSQIKKGNQLFVDFSILTEIKIFLDFRRGIPFLDKLSYYKGIDYTI